MLGDEAGDGHAGGGVDFEQVDAVTAVGILGNDVVDADNAVAVQDVVDARRLGLQGGGEFVADAGRSDFLYLAVILGVVIKELVVGHDFGNREDDRFLLGLVAAHGDLGTVKETLNHHVVALLEGKLHGIVQLVTAFHLGHAEA